MLVSRENETTKMFKKVFHENSFTRPGTDV